MIKLKIPNIYDYDLHDVLKTLRTIIKSGTITIWSDGIIEVESITPAQLAEVKAIIQQKLHAKGADAIDLTQ